MTTTPMITTVSSRIIYDGKIDGEFNGFNQDVLFKMRNGTYWIQAEYQYWYHYSYSPDVTITEQNGKYILNVEGKSIQVRKIIPFVESKIDGTFNGWDGDTTYKLWNGQVWQQNLYQYEYCYAYAPDIVIYLAGGGYKMSVAGTTAGVRQVR